MNKRLLFLALLIPVFLITTHVFSAAGDNVSGWAWSDNIGWISFNCTDTSSCTTSPYGVNVDLATGYFSGFAWSDNIGWVNMAPAGPYPTGSGAVSDRAKLANNKVTGWIRACAVFVSGCNGTLRPANENGGWDGWISTSGIATNGSPYGVILNGNKFESYAWGSDIVGWMQWNPTGGGVTLNNPLNVSCSASPTSVALGANVTWTSVVSGGTGSYTYLWAGDAPLAGKTTNPAVVTYSNNGTKSGSITVTSGSDNKTVACSNSVTVGGGGGGGGTGCGNNVVEIGEQCDDGNTTNGDGCSSACSLENPALCGNSVTNPGETCDDGNKIDGDGCSATCQTETANTCGNHVIDPTEDCDFTSAGVPIFRAGDSCSSLGFSGGTLGCTSTCVLNLTQCTQYQCSDGQDNDGDGLIDTNDPGCCSASDNDETGTCSSAPAQCSDGIDNDGDGKIDFTGKDTNGDGTIDIPADPGCSSPTDNSEFNVNPPGGEV